MRPRSMIPGNEVRKSSGLERLHPLVHDGMEAGSLRGSCCVEDAKFTFCLIWSRSEWEMLRKLGESWCVHIA